MKTYGFLKYLPCKSQNAKNQLKLCWYTQWLATLNEAIALLVYTNKAIASFKVAKMLPLLNFRLCTSQLVNRDQSSTYVANHWVYSLQCF